MTPILRREPITQATIAMIGRQLGMGAVIARIGEADPNKGAGVINDHTKCLWTKKGHRITITHEHGTTVASCSKEVDPEHDKV